MNKKIVMLCDFFDKDLTYQENILLSAFVSRGHDCQIICAPKMNIFDYYSQRNKYDLDFNDESNIHRSKYLFRFGSLKLLRNLYKKIEQLKPDVLFVHDVNFSLLISAFYVRKYRECILVCDNHCDETNSAKSFISKYFIYKFVKRIIVWVSASKVKKFYGITPMAISFMRKHFKIPEEKIGLLPLCIEKKIQNDAKHNHNVLEELNISPNKFVIFTGGKINESKRTHLLTEAVKDRDDIVVLICGSFEDLEYEKRVKSGLHNKNFIKFLGWQSNEDIQKFMEISDVAIFPGSQSVMWQQALGAGLPLLVGIGNINGILAKQDISYMLKYNAINVLNENDDFSKQINNYISKLQNNSYLYNEKVEAANKTVREILSYDIYIKEIESWI